MILLFNPLDFRFGAALKKEVDQSFRQRAERASARDTVTSSEPEARRVGPAALLTHGAGTAFRSV